MKIYKNITIIFLIFFFLGCEDYLDKKTDSSGLISNEDIWKDRDKIKTVAYRLYDCTEWFFENRYNFGARQPAQSGKNYSDIVVASGEVICMRPVPSITSLISGDWVTSVNNSYANPDFWMAWEDSWEAIYVSNQILANIDKVTDEVMNTTNRNQIKGEAFLFRAWAYHEIFKRWGAMYYYKEEMLPTQEYNDARPTLSQQIEDIVADLDSAIFYLPQASYLNDKAFMGRCGKAAAMALKSRALTTAASPNFQPNQGSDPDMWIRAAEAAWDVILLSRTEEKIGLYQGDYNNIFNTEKGTIEGLWPRYYEPIGPVDYNLSWGWANMGGYHGYSPTQEIVDKFETIDGWPVNDSRYDGLSGYDDQNPYVNRDPRFYLDILHHGSTWAITAENQQLDLRTEPLGDDRATPTGNDFGNSKTGYLCRKMLPDKFNVKAYNTAKYMNAPYIRMAEMYLNYAEAVNEAYKNPNRTSPSGDLTAVGAVNEVRSRVSMNPVRTDFTGDDDYLLFQERVRNEFFVELCFEYYIWHARIRWRTAHELNDYDFHGVLIVDDSTATNGMNVRFERFPIHIDRKFEEKHYRYPLRQRDLQLSDKLVQNPGW